MESVISSPSIPFRSRKLTLQATPNKPGKLSLEDRPTILETPEKSSRPARVRNQNMALSISDVKRTARMLRKGEINESDPDSDALGSRRSGMRSQTRDLEKLQRGSVKSLDRSVNLPEKYLRLCDFFNVIVSVIPLLRMRRKSPTFTNICPKIQSLTDRRFTFNHLAQLKYILPEAVVVKRIQVRDERTDCMKEELLISLDMESVKCSKNLKDIREMFRARIEDYYESHPEETDIPEAELPVFFYQSNQIETSATDNCAASVSESSSALATPIKDRSAEFSGNALVKKDDSKGSIEILGTPLKEASTPIRFMAKTPVIQTSKRCYMSPDDVACGVPTKLVRRPIRTRSLKFDFPEDNAETEVQEDDALGSNVDSDINDMIPKNLLQSVREKERKISEEQDPAISQARRRHQLMSGLPKLFDITRLMFQSINRSVMTKEEFLYKIIAGHSDVVDREEIEEQFKLLQELAPEYISERVCRSGGTLVCVNKSLSAQSVRAKFLEA